jgi:hypothetical protein
VRNSKRFSFFTLSVESPTHPSERENGGALIVHVGKSSSRNMNSPPAHLLLENLERAVNEIDALDAIYGNADEEEVWELPYFSNRLATSSDSTVL